MDLTLTGPEAGPRRRVPLVAPGEPALGVRPGPAAPLRRPRRRRSRSAASGSARSREGRWVGVAWPEEYGGRDAGPDRSLHRHRGAGPGPRPGARRPHRRQPRRADDPRPRDRRAAGPLAPEDPLAPRRSGASSSASRARAATSRRSRRAPRASTAAGCSTGRRSGRATRSSPTGACAWPAPIRTRRSRRASRTSSSTCAPPASRSGRCARSPTSPSSTRCSSPTCSSRRTASSGRSTRAGGSRTQTLTHERGVNPRQLVDPRTAPRRAARELAAANGACDDPRIAPRLAQAFVEVQIFRLHNWRSISRTAQGRGARARRQHQQALVVRDEQAPPRHRDGRARAGTRRCGDGARDNPVDGRWQRSWLYYQATLDLGRDERDPAQRHRRAHPRPPPRAEAAPRSK